MREQNQCEYHALGKRKLHVMGMNSNFKVSMETGTKKEKEKTTTKNNFTILKMARDLEEKPLIID